MDTITVNGEPRRCQLVKGDIGYTAESARQSRTLCIDPSSRLILQYRVEGRTDGIPTIATYTFTSIERDANLEDSLFAFQPPEGATQMQPRSFTPPRAVLKDSASTTAPGLMRKTDPEYTEEARKAHYQGTVVLSVTITAEGDATDLKVVNSIGMGLDEKALEAVRQWKFTPGYRDGKPVAMTAKIEVNFRLLDQPRDQPPQQ